MADHRRRLDAARYPQLRHCVFDEEQRRLRVDRRTDGMRGIVAFRGIAEHQRADIQPDVRSQRFGALVDPFAINRLGAIERFTHARILRALPGEHEDDGRRGLRGLCFDGALLQLRQGLIGALGDHHGAMREGAAARLQRRCHVGERDAGIGCEMAGKIGLRAFERCCAPCRKRQYLQPVLLLGC
ncbi:conserved hypothetical protein, partial [Ricinus communis]